MLRKIGALLLVSGLAACGSTNEDGSVASGPLGQTPLMTAEVEAATRQGVDACIEALTTDARLSALTTRGFTPWRNGYRRKIDNPLIFAGDSSVAVRADGRDCRVIAGPLYPVEISTVQSITSNALRGRGQAVDVRFKRSGDNVEIILR